MNCLRETLDRLTSEHATVTLMVPDQVQQEGVNKADGATMQKHEQCSTGSKTSTLSCQSYTQKGQCFKQKGQAPKMSQSQTNSEPSTCLNGQRGFEALGRRWEKEPERKQRDLIPHRAQGRTGVFSKSNLEDKVSSPMRKQIPCQTQTAD